MATALVLGSDGFIGRRVTTALGRMPGTAVVGVVRGGRRGSSSSTLALDLVTADITMIARVIDDIGPSVVVNCAGATDGSPSELILANVVTLARLLEGIEHSAVRPRLVQLGSAAEYGRGPVGRPVDEATAPNPVSAYGISKLAASQLALRASDETLVEAVVLRVFNAVGPGMPGHTLPGSVVARLRTAVSDESAVLVTGPLDAVRDFIDVRDIAAAVAAASTAAGALPPILNVGSGTGHSARELVTELARRTGFRGTIEARAPGSPRSTDVPWQVADVGLAARALGWRTSHDLASICEGALGPVEP